jgi:hypothetical protein
MTTWGPSQQDSSNDVFMAPWEFLWYDPSISAIPPTDLSLSRHFTDWGVVIARTGWAEEDMVFSFKSGVPGGHFGFEQVKNGEPNAGRLGAGHDHPDQNSFILYAGGEFLATDNGTEFPKRTASHNTILVDGKGQIGEGKRYLDQTHPEFWESVGYIREFLSNENYDFILGDATACYEDALGLTKFERRVLFRKPDDFIVYDTLVATSPKRFDWILRNLNGQFTVNGDWIEGRVNNASLAVYVALPETFLYEITAEPSSFQMIQIRPEMNVTKQRFLTALIPRATTSPLPQVFTLGSTENSTGIRIKTDTEVEYLFFSHIPTRTESHGGFHYQGEVVLIGKTLGGDLKRIVLINGKALYEGERPLIAASNLNVSLEVQYEGPVLRIFPFDAVKDIHEGGGTEIKFYAPRAQYVFLKGRKVNFEKKEGYTVIALSELLAARPGGK